MATILSLGLNQDGWRRFNRFALICRVQLNLRCPDNRAVRRCWNRAPVEYLGHDTDAVRDCGLQQHGRQARPAHCCRRTRRIICAVESPGSRRCRIRRSHWSLAVRDGCPRTVPVSEPGEVTKWRISIFNGYQMLNRSRWRDQLHGHKSLRNDKRWHKTVGLFLGHANPVERFAPTVSQGSADATNGLWPTHGLFAHGFLHDRSFSSSVNRRHRPVLITSRRPARNPLSPSKISMLATVG